MHYLWEYDIACLQAPGGAAAPRGLAVPGPALLGMVSTKLFSTSNLGTWGEAGLIAEACCEALTQIDPQAAPDVLRF